MVATLIVALIGIWAVEVSEGAGVGPTRSDCQRSCGNLTIPYPFGIQGQQGCYFEHGASPMSSFIVSCEQVNGRPSLFMYNSSYNFELLHISVETHEIRSLWFVSRDCFDSSGHESRFNTKFGLPRFRISSTRNTFTAVGCDTFALFQGRVGGQAYATGCISYCESLTGISNGTCSGLGCCQTENIPKNVTNFGISIVSSSNHSLVKSFNPCGYAFLAETGYFNFSTQSLFNITETRMPMVLDWSVGGNQTCDKARSSTSYMCADNTHCTDADNGSGYVCNCMEGYQGNPYLPNGCQAINNS